MLSVKHPLRLEIGGIILAAVPTALSSSSARPAVPVGEFPSVAGPNARNFIKWLM